jgi:hypothetical protein
MTPTNTVRNVTIRFYDTAEDRMILEWLDQQGKGTGNESVKRLIAGALASSGDRKPASSEDGGEMPISVSVSRSDILSALREFSPEIRRIVDASLASLNLNGGGAPPDDKGQEKVAKAKVSALMLDDDDDDDETS